MLRFVQNRVSPISTFLKISTVRPGKRRHRHWTIGGFVVGEAPCAVHAGIPFVDIVELFRLLDCTYVRPLVSRLDLKKIIY